LFSPFENCKISGNIENINIFLPMGIQNVNMERLTLEESGFDN
jgi:hypothetical protein